MILLRVLILVFLCSLCFVFPSIQGKLHSYTKQKHLHRISQIPLPPAPAPVAVSPSYNVFSVGSAPVFNVQSFGAIGDGVADDTRAIKMAWDTACVAEKSGILLVPEGYSFMIQSTIFTGPCKSRIKVQVILAFC